MVTLPPAGVNTLLVELVMAVRRLGMFVRHVSM